MPHSEIILCLKDSASEILVLEGSAYARVRYEPRHEKNGFCICENKDADQLRSNCAADQCLCFRYTDSTIPLLPKCYIHVSSL